MVKSLEAIYENGVFKPLEHPKLLDGQKVKITFESLSDSKQDELLDLIGTVYAGLSEKEINEIEKIALIQL